MMKTILIILFCVFTCYGQEVTIDQLGTISTSGTVALWHANNNGVDSSPNSNTATAQNGAGYAASKFGNGFELDGVNQYYSIAEDGTTLSSLGEGTVMAWINSDVDTAGMIFAMGQSDSSVPLWFFGTVNIEGYNLFCDCYYGGAYKYRTYATNNISKDIWHHVAVTVSDTTPYVKFYINGALEARNDIVAPTAGNFFSETGGDNFAIGVLDRATDYLYFNGTIEEVAVINRVLSAKEIKDIYVGITE